jgi:tetratricopeptide (TPR) repeat protein
MTGITIRRTVAICTLAFGLAWAAAPAFAQSGQIKGKVSAEGVLVEGATVLIENLDNGSKPLTTKTNKKGEYIQVGLYPGKYKITAQKDALSQTKNIDIHLDMATLDFKLGAAGDKGAATASKEEAAKAKARADAMTKAFSDGVALSNEGTDLSNQASALASQSKTDEASAKSKEAAAKFDGAVAKFNEVIAAVPNCAECYANIGTVYGMAKKYDEAETAYKKAVEIKPDFADAYNGLANVYNAEKKFDLAAEASKKAMSLVSAAPAGGAAGAPGAAAGAPTASQVFNQGVILWNAGKIPEAKAQFEAAVKADPNMADARYWLGMSLVNAGTKEAMAEAKPHFETYLKLAPTGQYADTAKAILASIK